MSETTKKIFLSDNERAALRERLVILALGLPSVTGTADAIKTAEELEEYITRG